MTDMISPAADTVAGICLRENLATLRQLRCSEQDLPLQSVDVKDIPEDLKVGTAAFCVGSPHNHDPDNNHIEGDRKGCAANFKQNVFYSMCWHTPADTAVIMTYSQEAAGKLIWWSIMQAFPTRVTMIAPAWFRSYRPRIGLASDISELGPPRDPDTVVAIYAPPEFMKQLQWHGTEQRQLDVAATLARWLVTQSGRLVTFGTYTAELECDIARVAVEHVRAQTVTVGSSSAVPAAESEC